MKIKLAETILSKVDFDSNEDLDTYPESEYTCNCGQSVILTFRNFRKHSFSNFTNLEKGDVAKIEALVDNRITSETNSFLDFYCPKCKKPIRFYFFSWAGGKHGQHGFQIKYIIE